jgi:hypothetical protein
VEYEIVQTTDDSDDEDDEGPFLNDTQLKEKNFQNFLEIEKKFNEEGGSPE